VGINTENPQGILHIDGGATPSKASDDVLIDAEGRLGAGVAIPAAKVDLSATAEGGALRIADGTQGDGKVLVSGANGAGSWITLSSAIWWYASLTSSATLGYTTGTTPYRPFVSYTGSSGSQDSVDRTNGTITVPAAGKYRITFSQHYMSNRTGTSWYWAKTELQVNGSSRWAPSTWARAGLNWGTLPTYTAILNLQANNVLRLALVQAETFNSNSGTVHFFMVELLQPAQ
jgi:hypothetical protein